MAKPKSKAVAKSIAKPFRSETVAIADLRPHPRNYRGHPEDQLAHLVRSLKRFGVYRNIVAAKDGTILAGHGVVEAAKKAGLKSVPIIRLNVAPESSAAIKVLVGDNEIEHLAEQNDRLLSQLLKQVKDDDVEGLLGTGFDDMMLTNFVMVTRPESEIKDFDEAAAWVGMPEYEDVKVIKVVVNFRNDKDRSAFAKKLGVSLTENTKSVWWPPRKRGTSSEPSNVVFENK